MNARTKYGINWSRLPAFVIVTPKGNYFPIDMNTHLGGDHTNIDKMLGDFVLDFAKGRLTVPTRYD